MSEPISARQFHESEGVDDWRVVGDGAAAHFRTGSFAESARFVHAIGQIPGVEDHPPAVDVRAGGVTVRLISVVGDYFGMTARDVEVARQISRLAREGGLSADPSAVQSLLVIPGAPDIAEGMPFWRAVLGYEPRPDSPEADLVDPHDRGPAFWFESMDEPRPGGGGAIHVAIWVPPTRLKPRRGRPRRRRPDGSRRVRAVVVDPGRCGRQRGRHRDRVRPRLTIDGRRAAPPAPALAAPSRRPVRGQSPIGN